MAWMDSARSPPPPFRTDLALRTPDCGIESGPNRLLRIPIGTAFRCRLFRRHSPFGRLRGILRDGNDSRSRRNRGVNSKHEPLFHARLLNLLFCSSIFSLAELSWAVVVALDRRLLPRACRIVAARTW